MSGPNYEHDNHPNQPEHVDGAKQIQVAIAKSHLGGKEVIAGSSVALAGLENSANDQLSEAGEQLESPLWKRTLVFEPEVVARRASADGYSVFVEPTLRDGLNPDPTTPPAGYLLPPWQELHPHIGEMFRRGNEAATGDQKKLRQMEFHSYGERSVEALHHPIVLMATDRALESDQAPLSYDRSNLTVLWSSQAFMEAAQNLVAQFETLTTPVSRSNTIASNPDTAALKLRQPSAWRKQVQAQETQTSVEIPLNQFLDRCPCYLAGIAAYEAVHRLIEDTALEPGTPDITVSAVKLRPNWDLEVQFKFGTEVRELIVACRQPERLSFDWTDRNMGLADLEGFSL